VFDRAPRRGRGGGGDPGERRFAGGELWVRLERDGGGVAPLPPSSETYERPLFEARISDGFSSAASKSARMSGWRNVALSSKLNFASIASTRPSGFPASGGVTIRGLISASVQSLATKSPASASMIDDA
jgi:hypothetical protein